MTDDSITIRSTASGSQPPSFTTKRYSRRGSDWGQSRHGRHIRRLEFARACRGLFLLLEAVNMYIGQVDRQLTMLRKAGHLDGLGRSCNRSVHRVRSGEQRPPRRLACGSIWMRWGFPFSAALPHWPWRSNR